MSTRMAEWEDTWKLALARYTGLILEGSNWDNVPVSFETGKCVGWHIRSLRSLNVEVEPVDPDEADKSQKRKKKPASTQEGASKRPKSEPKPKTSEPPVVAEQQAGTFSRKGKEKVDGFPTQPPVDTMAEERLMTKLAVKASRLDSFVDPSLPTPTGQTSGRGSNQMSAGDFTSQVNQISGNLPCEGQMTQSMSNMASTLSMAMEEHSRVWKFWASLEDQLAQAKKEEEVLKAKILDLEKEKRLMNERVAMMEKKDLYELLEAKMQGYREGKKRP
ncbi:hypothetical protein R1sor_014574 [Riccia sorocarpa]|uniref:Uncharacterized protein n=1 Tax=Riccia sorocarpa TaxID=122646 RepID=A0ABD3HDL6_9MARC